MHSNRLPRKVRTESDVMKMHYASLSRARKANQMEDRRHAMRVEEELTSAVNVELASMERERKRIQRELAALKLQSNKDALRRHQVAWAREVVRQQEQRASLVPSPLPLVESSFDETPENLPPEFGAAGTKEGKARRGKEEVKVKDKNTRRRSLNEKVERWIGTEEPKEEEKITRNQLLKQSSKKERFHQQLPSAPFKDRMGEARRARYIRSHDPKVVERERELTASEIFASHLDA